MLNYLLGVERENDRRFRLVAAGEDESKSQTREVSAYVIHPQQNSRFKYPVTIVDTPGFGDTEGLDDDTFSMLGAFFNNAEGINYLYSIGLVVSAPTSRLTASYSYVFEQFQRIFGNDVVSNIHLLITFADVCQTPPAVEVVKKSGIPISGTYAVNNSCLFNRNQQSAIVWDTMMTCMRDYFGMLVDATPVSTTRTKRVIMQRETIERKIQKLQEKVQEGLNRLETLQNYYETVKKKAHKREANKEKLMIVGRQFRSTQLEVHQLIRQAHASFCELEEIALKPDAFTVVEYIDLLIRQAQDEGNKSKMEALEASREAAKWLSTVRNQVGWDPFDQRLEDLKQIGLQLSFDDDECEVQFLRKPTGFVQTLKKIFFQRSKKPTNADEKRKPEPREGIRPPPSPKVVTRERLAERIRKVSIPLGKINGYDLYELRKEVACWEKYSHGIYHVLKPDVPVSCIGKIVMLVGMTGAFGKDVEDRFVAIVTFSDDLDPPALNALKKAGIPYREIFNVNNSPVFSNPQTGTQMKMLLWEMNLKKMKLFCEHLESSESSALYVTREVLQRRLSIEETLKCLQKEVQNGLEKLKELKEKFQQEKEMGNLRGAKYSLQDLACEFQKKQLEVQSLIHKAHTSLVRLEKLALKADTTSLVGYIENTLIPTASNDPEKLQALMAAKDVAVKMENLRDSPQHDPFKDELAELQELGVKMIRSEDGWEAFVFGHESLCPSGPSGPPTQPSAMKKSMKFFGLRSRSRSPRNPKSSDSERQEKPDSEPQQESNLKPLSFAKPLRIEDEDDRNCDSPLETEPKTEEDSDVFEDATLIKVTEEELKIYEPKKRMTMMDRENKLFTYTVGRRTLPIPSYGKVILLAGATGAGKTTLMSTMLNYVFGVDWTDSRRFQMVTTEEKEFKSQTREVSAYVIYPRKKSRFKYPLTIVDMPGFGDTERLDDVTFSMLQAFLKNKEGIDRLHSVGLVIPATTSRLTPGYAHVFQQFQKIFGKDVICNIHLLITFAVSSQTIPALEVVKEAGIPYYGTYTVNNNCLFDKSQQSEIVWKHMMASMGDYFKMLEDAMPVSTNQIQQVLKHREAIEGKVQELQEKVQQGLNRLEILQEFYGTVRRRTRRREATREKLMSVGRQFRSTQLEVHQLIHQAHASFCELQEIALKPAAFTVVEYIDLLIRQAQDEGDRKKMEILEASREAAKWLSVVSDQADWDPFDQHLEDLKQIGLQLSFDDDECEVQFLRQPKGFIHAIKKIILARWKKKAIDEGADKKTEASEDIYLPPIPKMVTKERLAEKIRGASIPLGKINGYDLYELRKEAVCLKEDSYGIYHVLKPDVPVTCIGKIVMFVGVTGAGKTSLINSLVNYVLGVEWEDEFRFKLINEKVKKKFESCTKEVSAYMIHAQHGSRFPYTLTIIDTPGLADTSGPDADNQLVGKLQKFYQEGQQWDIIRLHAVGFTLPVNVVRLTGEQKYVFDSVLRVFGKDVEDRFVAMVTFADESDPPALETLKEAGINCYNTFLVNNSPFFSDPQVYNQAKMLQWKTSFRNFKLFFDHLETSEAASLDITRKVLDERLVVEGTMERLQEEIQDGLEKLLELKVQFQEEKNMGNLKKAEERLQNLACQFQRRQLAVQSLIHKAHTSLVRLEKLALKADTTSLVGYIENTLIPTASNDPEKLQALMAAKDVAVKMENLRDSPQHDPFKDELAELQELGVKMIRSEDGWEAFVFGHESVVRTMAAFYTRKQMS
ncbi:unnamed protein product [Darwinula stevensoni]|uniref:AIG1-type G domain-containing protein n=1 Tax=Darwinula stevensoni TaxID=69355 RepID=A0A7R9A685_9CRUS|nr:unnamed protein product [Darwinula stevensoni]CAG0888350.1 unnamed protein product [Darwinula stevensoni]